MSIDGNGISLIITACAGGLVMVGTFAMQVVTFIDTRKLKRMSSDRDVQIREVKDLVNGKSEQLNAAIAKDSFEAGRMHERVCPDQPSPAAVSVVLTPVPAPAIIPVAPPEGTV
jgi:hypothetical protein